MRIDSRVPCVHCGLPSPPPVGDTEPFCCAGCEAANRMIRACNLEEFYRLRARLGDDGRPVDVSEAIAFEEMDDPAFIERRCRQRSDGSLETRLVLDGVHCAACLWLIERLPAVLDGLLDAQVDMVNSTVRVRWDPDRTPLSGIASTLRSLGYHPRSVMPSEARALQRASDRRFLVRIGVAGACAGNLMLIAFAMYGDDVSVMNPSVLAMFRWVSLGLALLTIAWPGRVFLEGAIRAIRMRAWHLDMPIALALVVALLAGAVTTVRGVGEVYFDSIGMLVFLLLVGRWLQAGQRRRAADAIELLFTVTPSRARRVDGDAVRVVAVESLEPGHVVEVLPHESVPVDGEVVSGRSASSDSVLTGESRPRPLEPGSVVAAGEVNLTAPIRLAVTAVGRGTRVGRMMDLIEGLSRRRVPVLGTADRLAGPFVVIVMSLSLLTVALHASTGLGEAISHAVALLVVCCPCALALATPLASSVAIGGAASSGILVKGGDVLEVLSRPGRLLLDKTGTLTTGQYRLVRWVGDESLRSVVASMEASSTHPIAVAIRSAAADDPSVGVTGVEHEIGHGIRAMHAGREILAGSRRLLASAGVAIPGWAESAVASAREIGATPVLVAAGGVCEAVAICGDTLRPEAADAIRRLRSLGWSVGVLSGDDAGTVRAVASRLGIDAPDAIGDASPQRKLEIVEGTRERVVMVGDGVNDSAALAGADVGIAVSGGAEASLSAADVYLAETGLDGITDLIDRSRLAVSVIRVCIGAALTYNVVAGTLAVMGMITPLMAAVLMPLSSMTVIALSLRASRGWSVPWLSSFSFSRSRSSSPGRPLLASSGP